MAIWHQRALSLRERGHTFKFIAGQVGVDEGLVTAYLVRIENEREAKRNVSMSGTSERIGPSARLNRIW